MNISRLKFVLLLLAFAVVYLFAANLLLNQPIESLFGSLDTQATWQATISTLLSPIKIILMGPLLPCIEFLRQDPDTPPPFFLITFGIYWTVLALLLHFLFNTYKTIRTS